MEIVAKRRRLQETRPTEVSQEVINALVDAEKLNLSALNAVKYQDNVLTSKQRQRRLDELTSRQLDPQQIRDQLDECLARGNTPRQLISIIKFLHCHQLAVLLGDTLPPLNSAFSKIPFGRNNKV